MGFPYEVAKRFLNKPGSEVLARGALMLSSYKEALGTAVATAFISGSDQDMMREMMSLLNVTSEVADQLTAVRRQDEAMQEQMRR